MFYGMQDYGTILLERIDNKQTNYSLKIQN